MTGTAKRAWWTLHYAEELPAGTRLSGLEKIRDDGTYQGYCVHPNPASGLRQLMVAVHEDNIEFDHE